MAQHMYTRILLVGLRLSNRSQMHSGILIASVLCVCIVAIGCPHEQRPEKRLVILDFERYCNDTDKSSVKRLLCLFAVHTVLRKATGRGIGSKCLGVNHLNYTACTYSCSLYRYTGHAAHLCTLSTL